MSGNAGDCRIFRLGRVMIAAHPTATWFETRGVAALLTMRVSDLIPARAQLRSSLEEPAAGGRLEG